MKTSFYFFLLFVIITATYSTPAVMQDSNKTIIKKDFAKIASSKLQQKILLSDEQTSKVKDILSEYLAKTPAAEDKIVTEKINSLLDEKQKAKFDIIKNEWWTAFMKAVKRPAGK